MKAKHLFIGEYIDKSPKDRIYQLLDNYRSFTRYLDSYKENVVNLMLAMREYYISPSEEELGVRVQTTRGTSDITASKAIDRVELEECFEKMRVTKELFPDPEELRLISTAVFEWNLMGKEYRILSGFIDMMQPDDRSIFVPYIKREKRVSEIAADQNVEWDSANKKVYRIRKALIEEVMPWFNEYKVSVPA